MGGRLVDAEPAVGASALRSRVGVAGSLMADGVVGGGVGGGGG